MDTAAVARERPAVDEPGLVWGSWLMIIAAIGFIGYAILFFIRDLSGGFLELGIGPNEVNVGKDQIEQFSPSLYAYISHLQIALSGFIAAVGIAVIFLTFFGVRRGKVRFVGVTYRRTLGKRKTLRAYLGYAGVSK